MPGRVSSAAPAAPRTAQKSTLRRTTASPSIAIPDEGPSSSLRARICGIFSDVQRSAAGHRKLVVSLRKVQESCCYESPPGKRKDQEDFGEDDFNVELARCVIRLMSVKKSESIGDRIVRFLGLFLKFASDKGEKEDVQESLKDAALVAEEETDEVQGYPDNPSTRLVSHILSILLPLTTSKEKVVRYRATQLVAHIINSLDSLDDDSYHMLRMGLQKRLRDKESMIRVQAVLGLGRLAGNEGDEDQDDHDSDNEEATGLLNKLLEILQNDPSADIRRSLLLNLPLTPSTLPYLLERARDTDPVIRRALYSRLLPALGDFRHLSLSMREKLLRWGLRDRDENVRKATGRLFRERWIEDCVGPPKATDGTPVEQAATPSMDGLLELLERIDIVNSATSNGTATEAMKEFWSGRRDYRDAIIFDDSFWQNLTPESIFVARSLNDFWKGEDSKDEALAEEKMPEVTKLAFFLQRYTNNLVNCIRYNNAMIDSEQAEDTVEKEFVVEQLLHIAKALDYSDEIGRRKMFALLRESLALAELPEEITKLVVDVLRDVCGPEAAGEREFCGIVLEAIAEVHDNVMTDELTPEGENESFHSARSELTDSTPTKPSSGKKDSAVDAGNTEAGEDKAIHEIMINMKCLHIAQCMLENVEGDLQQNIHLTTMLNNLVVPAVRSHEAPIRERGLLCLGLCCLLDKALSEENLTLFLHCFTKGHDALQVSALYILSDILAVHPHLAKAEDANPALQKSIYKIFMKGLKAAHTPEVQSTASIGLCKLMLTSVVRDEELLKQLVSLFFDSATKENAAVTQALSYFLPVFCHSKRENMEMMASIAASTVHTQMSLVEELDEEDDALGMTVIANMLIDWTDARKLVVQGMSAVGWNEAGDKEVTAANGDVHLILADSLLERALSHGCSSKRHPCARLTHWITDLSLAEEEKKALLTMLGKVYISPNCSTGKMKAVADLVTEAIDAKIATDTTTRNALNKLHQTLSKVLGEAHAVLPSIENQAADQTIAGFELKTGEASESDEMKMDVDSNTVTRQPGDTLLEELLDDEPEDL
ncbi:MAG: hypothetical protein Q9222_000336 [Ikaeria aurantiellina]